MYFYGIIDVIAYTCVRNPQYMGILVPEAGISGKDKL